MDKKGMKAFIISIIAIAIIDIGIFIYYTKETDIFQESTGKYFYKIDVINEGSEKVYKWDIGISEDETMKSSIENDKNREDLKGFREALGDMKYKKIKILYVASYLVLTLIVLFLVRKNNKDYNTGFIRGAALVNLFIVSYIILADIINVLSLLNDVNMYYKMIKFIA
jgi:hypothetical protein